MVVLVKTRQRRLHAGFLVALFYESMYRHGFHLCLSWLAFGGMPPSWERTATYGRKGIDPDARFGHFRVVPGASVAAVRVPQLPSGEAYHLDMSSTESRHRSWRLFLGSHSSLINVKPSFVHYTWLPMWAMWAKWLTTQGTHKHIFKNNFIML